MVKDTMWVFKIKFNKGLWDDLGTKGAYHQAWTEFDLQDS